MFDSVVFDFSPSRPWRVAETAAYLDYSKSHIYRLVYLGEIPHCKPDGRRPLFWKDDLDAWIKAGRKATYAEIEAAREKQ